MDIYLKKSINIFNKSYKKKYKNHENSKNICDEYVKKTILFRDVTINLNEYLNIIFNLNKKLYFLDFIVKKFINVKLNINCENNILSNIKSFLIPKKINIKNLNKNNYSKNIDLFLRKAHKDGFIDYENNYHNIKKLKYDDYNNQLLTFYYYYYYDLIKINNYDNKITYILNWLDINNEKHIIHYYMQYFFIL